MHVFRRFRSLTNTRPHARRRSHLVLLPAVRSFARVKETRVPSNKGAVIVEEPLKLRSYQEECIQAVLSHVDQGHRRMGISLATGSGKTVIFTQLISRLSHPTSPETATRTLVLAHRTELVQQAYNHCRRTYPDATIEIEMGSLHASGVADITVASIASLMSGDRIAKFNPAYFKLLLIDEVHHAVATRYLATLDHFGVKDVKKTQHGTEEMIQWDESEGSKPLVVGVSATMSRFDGLKLGKVLDTIVYHRDYLDMIEEQWLSPVKFTTVRTNYDLSGVRSTSSGDFATGELSRAVNTDASNEIAVRSWLEKAGPVMRKSTIVFCVDIQHVLDIVDKFKSYNIDARAVTSNTHAQTRREYLAGFKAGEFPVLVNCGVFTEGTDIPNIDCVILARPTRSRNLLVQMIGRGMRLHQGKIDCHVIDMVGSIAGGIVTVPTLMGLDPDEIMMEESLEAARDRIQRQKLEAANKDVIDDEDRKQPLDPGPPVRDIEFTDYDTVFDLAADSRADSRIRRLSPLSWVFIDTDKYVLSCRADSFLRLSYTEGAYEVTETRKLPLSANAKSSFVKSKPRVIIEGVDTLEMAVRAADTYALSRYPRWVMVWQAPWRDGPASEAQLKFLEKLIGGKDKLDGITKGKAMDIITKMKYGAIGRFDKEKKRREREVEKERKAAEKVEQMRDREAVKVGKIVA